MGTGTGWCRGSPSQLVELAKAVWLFPAAACLQLAELQGVAGTRTRIGI